MCLAQQRRLAAIITVIVVFIAAAIVICLILHMEGLQPFKNLEQLDTKNSPTEQLRKGLDRKQVANEEISLTDIRLKQAQDNAKKNVINTKPTSKDIVQDIKVPSLVANSMWELLTPKEDTMKEYGVTQQELDDLVAQYRKEHIYDIEKAPTTLTFSIDKWERANDMMQSYASNTFVEKRPYEDGLVHALYREGEL